MKMGAYLGEYGKSEDVWNKNTVFEITARSTGTCWVGGGVKADGGEGGTLGLGRDCRTRGERGGRGEGRGGEGRGIFGETVPGQSMLGGQLGCVHQAQRARSGDISGLRARGIRFIACRVPYSLQR